MMNQRIEEQDWNKVREEIRRRWGWLGADELEETQGDVDRLVNLIERKCGVSHDEAQSKLEELRLHYESPTALDVLNLCPHGVEK